jgi:hypothetical protein
MAQFDKKEKTPKLRRTRVLDNDETLNSELDVKLYQLNTALAEPFMRNGVFIFRVAFDSYMNGNPKRRDKSLCPLISLAADQIVQTENETAQRMLENFTVPTKTVRNGETRTGGHLFTDVTATETTYDIDLDAIFDAV